jgi:integrase
VRIKYLKQYVDRHGKTRLYVRLPGRPLVSLPVTSTDDPKFLAAYAGALNGEQLQTPVPKFPAQATKAVQGSLRELCTRYSEFLTKDTTLAPATKYERRRHYEEVCREVSIKGFTAGDMPVDKVTTAIVQKLLDRKQATPEASNDRRKALMAMFKWAIPRGLAKTNPVTETQRINTHSEGIATWKQEHMQRFVETHPLGTRAYVAFALLLYTGQRKGDVIRWGRQHVKDGALQFVQQKNERRSHKQMRITILPQLWEALETVPRDQMTFLMTRYGKPFTSSGFGVWFREVCDEAGLQGYSAHGLRKALQTIGADQGLSDRELMAIAGHESTQMTSLYTKKRDRDLLAESGMAKLLGVRFVNKIVSPETAAEKSETKRPKHVTKSKED